MSVGIFRSAFTVRRSSLVLGSVVVGLAFPAASMAATDTVSTTPIHKGSQGFMLRLTIQQGPPTGYGGRYPNAVTATLVKKSDSGHATETDTYTFSGQQKHLKFTTGSKALQYVKITGKATNGDGSINMAFHATGKPVHFKVPNGCFSDTGASGGTKRSGTLSGSYTLHANKLGTIKQKSFKATISNISWTCSRPTHGYEVQTLTGNPYVDVFRGAKGKVTETIDDSGRVGGPVAWSFEHSFIVRGLPSSDYKLSTTHLNTATVKGAGGITGTATYSSTKSSSHKTTGTMKGSLAAPFVSIGKLNAFPKTRSATQSHS
jgi:hypothetical protein